MVDTFSNKPQNGEKNESLAQEDTVYTEDSELAYGSDDVFFDASYVFLGEDDAFDEEEDLFSDNLSSLQGSSLVTQGDDALFADLGDFFLEQNDTDFDTSAETLDVLLGSKSSLNSVKDMFSNNDTSTMEMAVLSDTIQGQNVHEVLQEAGIVKNTDGSISLGEGWTAQSSTDSFTQYTHNENDTTLLVHQTLIVTGC